MKGIIEKILDVNIPLSPLFHLYPKNIKLKKTENIFINICILQAKRLISLNWKSIYAPNMMAERNGNKYVNGKDNLYIKR